MNRSKLYITAEQLYTILEKTPGITIRNKRDEHGCPRYYGHNEAKYFDGRRIINAFEEPSELPNTIYSDGDAEFSPNDCQHLFIKRKLWSKAPRDKDKFIDFIAEAVEKETGIAPFDKVNYVQYSARKLVYLQKLGELTESGQVKINGNYKPPHGKQFIIRDNFIGGGLFFAPLALAAASGGIGAIETLGASLRNKRGQTLDKKLDIIMPLSVYRR